MQLRTVLLLGPTALYMLMYAAWLHVVVQVLGIRRLSFLDTTGIYALMVLARILDILPADVGVADITGLGALRLYGVPSSPALVIMLALRILGTGTNVAMAALPVSSPGSMWTRQVGVRSAWCVAAATKSPSPRLRRT